MQPTIVYTKTDESPMMATYSLFPIFKVFLARVGVELSLTDISLASRILARFPEYLHSDQVVDDALDTLAHLVQQPQANVMKLPNISASIPQMHDCIVELQSKGYAIPKYPEDPSTPEEIEIKERYDKIKGSAVNPVLREGNSDRRAPKAVKRYAQTHPHSMGPWSPDSKSHVSHMDSGDFYGSEQSVTIQQLGHVTIRFVNENGVSRVLKRLTVNPGEVIDTSAMSIAKLKDFFIRELADAKKQDVLFSVHLKATMMKVSDPIIFGAVVSAFYQELFEKYATEFDDLNISPNNGMSDLERKITQLSEDTQSAIRSDIQSIYERQADLAYVDSQKGITNLHVPSNIIIDASIPAAIRSSGKMWGLDGKQKDTKFTIPDRCYAGIYQEVIEFCKEHGAFDVTTMGSVSNVGLMAQKAQEYGSHNKTFQIDSSGRVEVLDEEGTVIMSHSVDSGDIWRMCEAKDGPIQDWVKLAVKRARITGEPVVFWLDESRAQDVELLRKVETYLPQHDTSNLEIYIMDPEEAMRFSLDRCRDGLNTISATGNVLRDYLTDLFPILELGTSAKMLSIVPLMNGGGLFETGAGGSAPRLLDQLFAENHLSWDSLGEFLAMEASLEHLSSSLNHSEVGIVSKCLGIAIEHVLMNGKSPEPNVHELDSRGSHFYLCLYWAEALSTQKDDMDLASKYSNFAERLKLAESTILKELNDVQGSPVQLDGYYRPTEKSMIRLMRPSTTFNEIVDSFIEQP